MKRLGLLKRIKKRVPISSLLTIAEGIFNSKIRYGICVYLKPTFEREDVKTETLSEGMRQLQTHQNHMLRMVFGHSINDHVNMKKLREKIKMFSVNQMTIYHTLLEAYNVVNKTSSEKIQELWSDPREQPYSLRSVTNNDLKVPRQPKLKAQGFSYFAPKLYNMLPTTIIQRAF